MSTSEKLKTILSKDLSELPVDTHDTMKSIVRIFYDDIWNKFDVSPIDKIVAPEVIFRGTLEASSTTRDGLKRYVNEIGKSFPDFYQRIDQMWCDGDTCIARMHWSATHTSPFRGVPPTGKYFEYPGVGVFRIRGGQIREVWALGDTWGLWRVVLELGLDHEGKKL